VPSVSHLAPTHLGLDVHKDTISVAILAPDRDGPDVERITHDEASVRRLVARLGDPRMLRACYEAGPTGYDLARLLHSMRVGCEVIAPSLIPKAPGDRVKTDKRDCRRLARLHRAGELVCIRIPSIEEEAVRDLCRARAVIVEDRTRARHRLSTFLLRHGRPWRGGNAWTLTHERWLLAQRFDNPALAATYGHDRAVGDARDAQLLAIEADLAAWHDIPPFADAVHRLAAYRGITRLGALTLASEVGDWRRLGSGGRVLWVLRAGAKRVFQRGVDPAGPHHQDRQRPPARPAGGVGLGLPVPPRRRARAARTPAGPGPPGGGPCLAAQLRLCGRSRAPGRPHRLQERGRHRHRPGARWVPVGGAAGGLT